MRTRHLGLAVLDHVLHVIWQMCAMVGLATIFWTPSSVIESRALVLPLAIGLAFGLLTMPVMLKALRPALERRFPWAFGD